MPGNRSQQGSGVVVKVFPRVKGKEFFGKQKHNFELVLINIQGDVLWKCVVDP